MTTRLPDSRFADCGDHDEIAYNRIGTDRILSLRSAHHDKRHNDEADSTARASYYTQLLVLHKRHAVCD